MKFAPKTQEQLEEENLLPEGTYPFEVLDAENKQSKKGNDMIALKLRVFHGERSVFVDDWLLEAMAFKLLHFCEETGLSNKYEAGTLDAEDCKGKQGYVTLRKEPAKGDFGPKNAVKDYGKDEAAEANAKLDAAKETKDEDPGW